MSPRDPRFDRDRRPDAHPSHDKQHQMNMRAHHDIERSPEYFDASHSDEYYPERYLQQALNWNKRDLTLSDDPADFSEPQRAYEAPEAPIANYRGRGPKGYQRSDERILEEACSCLQHDALVDASDISLTCTAGIVTLEGTVNSRTTKRHAEDLIDQCRGVRDIDNRLQITGL